MDLPTNVSVANHQRITINGDAHQRERSELKNYDFLRT